MLYIFLWFFIILLNIAKFPCKRWIFTLVIDWIAGATRFGYCGYPSRPCHPPFSVFQKFRYCRYCIMQIFRCCKYLYIAQTPCQAPFNLSWNPLEEMLPLTACTDWSKSKFCRNIKSDLYDTGWSNYCRWWDWQLCPKYIFLSQTCKQPTMRVFWWREIWDLLWKQILWNSQKWHFRCPKRRYKTTFISPQLVGNMASETSESGLFNLGLVREKKVFCFSSFLNDRFWNFVF